jgi:hypothetical protein
MCFWQENWFYFAESSKNQNIVETVKSEILILARAPNLCFGWRMAVK